MTGSVLWFAVLATYLAGSIARSRVPELDRHWTRCLGVLVGIGLVCYVGQARVHPSVGRVHIHHWDVYHYYVGSKYFDVLGQDGLYEATVIADFEDDPDGFRPDLPIRDLRDTERERTRGEVVRDRDEIKRGFSEERWQAFKTDIAFFRAVEPERWRSSEITRDHGYNGTPLTTAVLGTVAQLSAWSPTVFLEVVVWADFALVILVALWIRRRLGTHPALAFLLFWLANPFNDYDFIGGSYLRYNYFLCLVAGLVLYRTGRRAASGAWLALSGLFRIFPVVFPAALLAADLIHPARRARLRGNRALYLTGAVTALCVAGATSLLPSPGSENPWAAQLETVGARNAAHAPNGISLRFPFFYDASHNVNEAIAAARRGEQLDWLAETSRTFRRRLPYFATALAAVAALAFAYARRASPLESWLLGIVCIFAGLILSHYYYAMLSLVPLIFREDRRVLDVLAGGLAIAWASSWLLPMREILDLRYAVFSVEIGLLLVALLVLRIFAARSEVAPGAEVTEAASA